MANRQENVLYVHMSFFKNFTIRTCPEISPFLCELPNILKLLIQLKTYINELLLIHCWKIPLAYDSQAGCSQSQAQATTLILSLVVRCGSVTFLLLVKATKLFVNNPRA